MDSKKKLSATPAVGAPAPAVPSPAANNANDIDGSLAASGANAAAAAAAAVAAAAVAAAAANDLTNRQSHKCSIANCDKEFKLKAHLARHYAQAHGIAIRSGSPRPIMKTRTAFYLQTTGVTKLSRRLCRHIIRSKKAARQPSYAINLQAVRLECEFVRKCTENIVRACAHHNKSIFRKFNWFFSHLFLQIQMQLLTNPLLMYENS